MVAVLGIPPEKIFKQQMLHSGTYCVAALLALATLASAIVPFGCHGDVCNVGGQDQFCSTIFNICRNCEEIRDECYHPILPQNCTPYCVDFLLKMEMKKEMERPCPPVSNITNGDHNGSTETSHASGTTVVTTCHQKFRIVGHSQTICGEFGIWSPALPSCEPDDCYEEVLNLTVPLSVMCAVLALGYLLLGFKCWRNKRRRRKRNCRHTQCGAKPRNSLDDDSNEQDTTLKLIENDDDKGNDTPHKDKARVNTEMMLPARKISDKDVKQSDSVVSVGTAAHVAKPNGVAATPVDHGEFRAQKPAPNLVEARCRPEHLNGSVGYVSPPNTSEMYGPAQEVDPVPNPLNAYAGRHHPIPADDHIRPGGAALNPNLPVPIVTAKGVQPTSTNTATPTVGAEGPPFLTDPGHHPQEKGDDRNVKFAVNGKVIPSECIRAGH